jgi:hypothetical protein
VRAADVKFGKVAFNADFTSRMWSSALLSGSLAAGLDATRSEMYEAVSRGTLVFLSYAYWEWVETRDIKRPLWVGRGVFAF